LNGAYNVRYLGALTDLNSGADTAISFQGTFTFDGKGGFTVAGQGTSAGAALKFQTTGQYTVLSSGMVEINNPFDPIAANSTVIFGGVGASGIIVGSSTDSFNLEDIFVAVPGTAAASATTLSGNYRVVGLEFLNGDFQSTRNSFFPMTSNGSGSLGNLTISGTAQSLSNKAATQTSNGATYTLTANGTGTLVIPTPSGVTAPNTLISGTKTMYVSPDGSFFVAGSPTGYDIEVGVKTGGATALDGLYFEANLNNFVGGSNPIAVAGAQGSATENAYHGSPAGVEIGHERTQPDDSFAFDFTFSDNFVFGSDGTTGTASTFSVYAIGANGGIAIGSGLSTNYLLDIYVKAPTMTAPAGTTVFLNPQGVVNGASFVPVTAQVAPGEIITMFGTGLGPATPVTASAPFPNTLGGVQVLINNTPAPAYFVSATQVSAVVPYTAPNDGSFLNIQVVNNGAQSNTVTVYSGVTSPGMFMLPTTATLFSGAIVHPADGSIVTAANPAKVGETVSLFLTGLGAVTGNVAAGSAAPSSPLSTITAPDFFVLFDDTQIQGNVLFAGLAPGFAGLYQVNVTIPQGVTKGSQISVWFETDDALNVVATIPIG
jgi:uncharacterized protein (TIGR03437 family)